MSYRLVILFAFLLVAALAQTPQRKVPLIDSGRGGIYQYEDRISWSIESFDGTRIKIKYSSAQKVIFGIMDNALFRVDMTVPDNWNKASARKDVLPRNDLASKFVDLEVDEVDKHVIVLSLAPSLQLVRFDCLSLTLIDDGGNNNPKDLAGLIDPFDLLVSTGADPWLYIISQQTRIARIKLHGNFPGSFQYYDGLKDNGNPSLSADIRVDGATQTLFLGGEDNKVYEVAVNEADFPASTFKTHTIATATIGASGLTVTAIAAEQLRPRVYVIVTDLRKSELRTQLSELVYVDVTAAGWVEKSTIPMDKFDGPVRSVVLDPTGILYLGTTSTPGSIIQISIEPLNYEHSVEVPKDVAGPVTALAFDPDHQYLYVSSINIATEPQIMRGHAAWGCEQNCFGHGTCSIRACACVTTTDNWQLPWCGTLPCAKDPTSGAECGGTDLSRGCNNGTCLCIPTQTGSYCQTKQCPNACTSPEQGTCQNDAGGIPSTCKCADGFKGVDCSETTFLPCSYSSECTDCTRKPGCGWCETSFGKGKCYDGDNMSPKDPTGNRLQCDNWNYQSCPSLGIFIGNMVIAALVAVMFLVNAISIIIEDGTNDADLSAREQWYRMQRSSKAYAAFHQLQMMGGLVLLATDIPTTFFEWGRPWLATLGIYSPLKLSMGFDARDKIGKRSIGQLESSARIYSDSFFINALVVWGVAIVALFILWLIGMIIAGTIKGGGSRRGLLIKSRIVYILYRVTELLYFGIVATSAAEVVNSSSTTGKVMGIVGYVVFGIVFPVIIFVYALMSKLADLLKAEGAKYMLFAFYGQMKPLFRKLLILPWAKRFVIASAFGFLSGTSLVVQLIVAIVILLVNIGVVFQMKPYADYLQRYLDIIVSALTILSLAPLFAFAAKLGAGAITAVTVIYLVFQMAAIVFCIGFFFYSWLQLHGIYSLGQICGGSKESAL